jgi:hypothetical protein
LYCKIYCICCIHRTKQYSVLFCIVLGIQSPNSLQTVKSNPRKWPISIATSLGCTVCFTYIIVCTLCSGWRNNNALLIHGTTGFHLTCNNQQSRQSTVETINSRDNRIQISIDRFIVPCAILKGSQTFPSISEDGVRLAVKNAVLSLNLSIISLTSWIPSEID